jgi:hypothetical protein
MTYLGKEQALMQCPHIIMKHAKTGKGKREKQESEGREKQNTGVRSQNNEAAEPLPTDFLFF